MRTFIISEVEVENLGGCGICFEDFRNGEQVYDVPCYHVYHMNCIESWWKIEANCPTCRSEEITGVVGGAKLRHRKISQWNCEKTGKARGKKLSDLTNREIMKRLRDLKVKVPGDCSRLEAIELLLIADPQMGVRIKEDIDEEEEEEEEEQKEEEQPPKESYYRSPSPPPELSLEEEQLGMSLQHLKSLSTKDLLAVLRSFDIPTVGVLEKHELHIRLKQYLQQQQQQQ